MPDRIRSLIGISGVELAILVVLGLALGVAVHALARLVIRRTLPDTGVVHTVLVRVDRPARILLPLLAVTLAIEQKAPDFDWLPGLIHVASLGVIAVFTWLAVRFVAGIEAAIVSRHTIDIEDNLAARRVLTQTRVLGRIAIGILVLIGAAAMLMTFPAARQIGTSLLASAGLAGLVAGFAARQVLGNLLAGVQIALTQPIRLDDVLVVEGEWGRVEEITSAYVVVRIWDERRLVLPLEYFISKPFQNWTRTTSRIIGAVFLWVDYALPLEPLRGELKRLCEGAKEWDRRVCVLQVTDANERAMQLRALVSSSGSSQNWDLRCLVREGLIAFVAREYPQALPKLRTQMPPLSRDLVAGTG
ncbi:MAG TPA: mechanosensitive ion channel domain-containing protein [Rhodanobacteraceae bacterium]|nr:mechanosensitive ion channel domain-containing protein [Rhodanobacteraceae bacterium]